MKQDIKIMVTMVTRMNHIELDNHAATKQILPHHAIVRQSSI